QVSAPRAECVAKRGDLKAVPPATAVPNQHCNAITSWAVDRTGEVTHVYAEWEEGGGVPGAWAGGGCGGRGRPQSRATDRSSGHRRVGHQRAARRHRLFARGGGPRATGAALHSE